MDLGSSCAVGELEETGEHAVVLRRVREDRVLEVHSMWNNAVVFIHPTRKRKKHRQSLATGGPGWSVFGMQRTSQSSPDCSEETMAKKILQNVVVCFVLL